VTESGKREPRHTAENPGCGNPPTAEAILAAAEAGARGGNVVFCVGSVLRGDDAAGPLLARHLEEKPVEGWTVVDGGQTPENDLGYLRRVAPHRLLLVDAAAMGLDPGTVRRLRPQDVAVQSLITTHTLPITYLLEELVQMCNEVIFLGIQPLSTAFFDPVSDAVRKAVEGIYRDIAAGGNFEMYPYVNM